MSKKIFIISFSLFLVVSVVFLWRNYQSGKLFAKKTTEIKAVIPSDLSKNKNDSTQGVVANDKNNNGENEGAMQKIIDGPVIGAVFASEKKKIFYYANQNLMQADLNGQNKESLGAHPFGNVEKVLWSLGREKAVVKSDGQYVFFDRKINEFTTFPNSTNLLGWGNLNGQFFYQYFNAKTDQKILDSSFSFSGTPWEEIVDLPYDQGVLLVHPVKNEGLFFPDPKDSFSGDVFKIDFSNKKKTVFLNYFHGMDFLFSPSGKKILESFVKKDGRLSLGIVDWETGAFQDLNFPTSVKKCVWSQNEEEIYCAAILFTNKVNLPEDWENKKGSFGDIFWKINVLNGKQERLLSLGTEEKTDAENLFLDSEGQRLFFIDRLSGGLFRINLLTNDGQPK